MANNDDYDDVSMMKFLEEDFPELMDETFDLMDDHEPSAARDAGVTLAPQASEGFHREFLSSLVDEDTYAMGFADMMCSVGLGDALIPASAPVPAKKKTMPRCLPKIQIEVLYPSAGRKYDETETEHESESVSESSVKEDDETAPALVLKRKAVDAVCTPAAKKTTLSGRKKTTIRSWQAVKTSHTVNELAEAMPAFTCCPQAENSKGCGQLYYMKTRATGDWSHTLCRKEEATDGSGRVKYVACCHYSFCILCDPSKVTHFAKPHWNRSKYYRHRDEKHADLIRSNGWTPKADDKDGGLCARVNQLARQLGYYE